MEGCFRPAMWLSLVLVQCCFATGTDFQGNDCGGLEFLPFLPLDTGSVSLPAVDDGDSGPITIPGGFPFGRSTQTTAYVSTNGYITFEGSSLDDPFPLDFPLANHDYTVAPFWGNSDISEAGTISYTVESREMLECVSDFISSRLCVEFTGRWMLLAEWYKVPQSQATTSLTNTFQGTLITDGEESYTVFIYQCGSMEWSSVATIGFQADTTLYKNHPFTEEMKANAKDIACRDQPRSNFSNVVYKLDSAPLCSDGDIRLDPCAAVEGQVLICSESQREWRSVCDDDWTVQDAAVVCRQLGYLPLGAVTIDYGTTSAGNMHPECDGTEARLSDCLVSGEAVCSSVGVKCQTENDLCMRQLCLSLDSADGDPDQLSWRLATAIADSLSNACSCEYHPNEISVQPITTEGTTVFEVTLNYTSSIAEATQGEFNSIINTYGTIVSCTDGVTVMNSIELDVNCTHKLTTSSNVQDSDTEALIGGILGALLIAVIITVIVVVLVVVVWVKLKHKWKPNEEKDGALHELDNPTYGKNTPLDQTNQYAVPQSEVHYEFDNPAYGKNTPLDQTNAYAVPQSEVHYEFDNLTYGKNTPLDQTNAYAVPQTEAHYEFDTSCGTPATTGHKYEYIDRVALNGNGSKPQPYEVPLSPETGEYETNGSQTMGQDNTHQYSKLDLDGVQQYSTVDEGGIKQYATLESCTTSNTRDNSMDVQLDGYSHLKHD